MKLQERPIRFEEGPTINLICGLIQFSCLIGPTRLACQSQIKVFNTFLIHAVKHYSVLDFHTSSHSEIIN